MVWPERQKWLWPEIQKWCGHRDRSAVSRDFSDTVGDRRRTLGSSGPPSNKLEISVIICDDRAYVDVQVRTSHVVYNSLLLFVN